MKRAPSSNMRTVTKGRGAHRLLPTCLASVMLLAGACGGEEQDLGRQSHAAVASGNFRLFTDDGGKPGKPITDQTVTLGDTFFVELLMREYDPGFSGLAGVSLDVAWDNPVMEIVDPFDPRKAVTPNLPLFIGGRLYQDNSRSRSFILDEKIRNNVGTIDGLGGSAFPAWGVGKPIGSDGDDSFVKPWALGHSTTDPHFAWLHFRAKGTGESVLQMRQGGLGIVTLPTATLSSKQLHFATLTVQVVAPQRQVSDTKPAVPVDLPKTPPSANPYQNPENRLDVNGDGFVTPLDAMILSNLLNDGVAGPLPMPPTGPVTKFIDTDGDGVFGPRDVLQVVNYLNSR